MRQSIIVFLALQFVAASPAQEKPGAEALFGAALHQEKVAGNLQAAIEGYRKVLAAKNAPRPLVAKALYQIGLCQEKLGKADARQTFQLVAASYADQKELAAQARGRLTVSYRSHAIVAVLPGNPFDSRLYSLQRNVLTGEFFAKLARDHGVVRPERNLEVRYRPDNLLAITFPGQNKEKAVAVVKGAMDALVGEMERRRASDPGYGRVRVHTPARANAPDGRGRAEGVLVMEGVAWGPAERQKTKLQIAALIAAISDLEALRAVVRQNAAAADADRIAKQIRASMTFHPSNDSWTNVTIDAPDATFLDRLLHSVPRKKIDLLGRVPLLDIDFVPVHMRDDWYIFNCCRTSPVQ